MENSTAQDTWNAVDSFINNCLVPADPILDTALAANAAAGLPPIDVTPSQAKLLFLLAKLCGARRMLEIGTLGGYSTIWLARALPADGCLITLELEEKHAAVARENLAQTGLAHLVDVRVGPALESLQQLQVESAAPFDLIFIDADKPNNPAYLAWAMRLSRQGSVIVVDNVVRDGAIANADDPDPGVQGSRRLIEQLGADPRLSATALQTVGSKGYDGLAIALVTGDPQQDAPA
jgi:predicted O-methyltransferase YrrM